MLDLISKCQKNNSKLVTFINPFSYMILRRNKYILSHFKVYFDGISLSLLFSIFFKKVKRKSFDFTSLAPIVFNDACSKNLSLYFIGTTDDNIESSVKNILLLYPGLNIIGYRSGYFNSNDEIIHTQNNILNLDPDIVVCGMGTPLQEQFLLELNNIGWNGYGYTCGGFFHQTAGEHAYYYPKLFDYLNIRWLYRMMKEPKVIRRVFFSYPVFFCVFIADLIKFKLFNSHKGS